MTKFEFAKKAHSVYVAVGWLVDGILEDDTDLISLFRQLDITYMELRNSILNEKEDKLMLED